MITIQFQKRYKTEARTLPASAVSDDKCTTGGPHKKTHKRSGWTIAGTVNKDYFCWVNQFEATHPEYGIVQGNFESAISATSEKAYHNFLLNHPFCEWDYMEI